MTGGNYRSTRDPIEGVDRPILRSRPGGLIAFTIPFLLAFPMQLVGQFFIGEILALALLPIAIAERRWILSNRAIRLLLGTGLLWLGSLVLTDILRDSSATDRFRGWGEIAITLLMLAVLRVVIGDDGARLQLALFGAVAGIGVQLSLNPTAVQQARPWSLGGAWALTILVLLVLPKLPRPFNRIAPEAILLPLAGFFVLQSARNAAGIAFVTAGFLVIARLSQRRPLPHRKARSGQSPRDVAVRLAAVALLATFALLSYSWVASSGLLGSTAAERYARQSAGSLGILVGGRQDNVASVIAIADSPIIGHGSRAQGIEYANAAANYLYELGYTTGTPESEAIPAHSYALGAWVSAGIGGVLFWLIVLVAAIRGLINAHNLDPPWMALSAYFAIGIIWDWLFSPFGGAGRTLLPLLLLVLIYSDERLSTEAPESGTDAGLRVP